MTKQSAVIDTCVILQDTNVIVRANQLGFPIITDIILRELDGLKKKPDVANDANQFFRNMSVESESLTETPDGKIIQAGDKLTKFSYKEQSLYVLYRENYKSSGNNDSKIREIARDYNFEFVTADRGNKIAAEAEGISAHFWSKPNSKNPGKEKTSSTNASPNNHKFKIASNPRKVEDRPSLINAPPGEGDKVYFKSRKTSVTLLKKIASGGEGVVYETSKNGKVAKIYHRDNITKNRLEKLELMTSKPIKHKSICWPTDVLYNASGEFCGYLMPTASGDILQTTVFIPALLKRKYPHWDRSKLVEIALNFAIAVDFLNERNVIIGDINPMNVLISNDGAEIKIVDCDSFQVEDHPCPVGTINFTAADIQGRDYKSFLRSKAHEEFALATMLFMILMPGKPPYSQEGGTSQADNIKTGEFPYPFGKEFRSQNIASGSWRFIWSHFPHAIKEAFHKTFRSKEHVSPSEWVTLLKRYKNEIGKGWHSNEIFPKGMKISAEHAIKRVCDADGCSNEFEVHKDFAAKKLSEGKGLYCESCLRQFTLSKLANESSEQQGSSKQTFTSSKLRNRKFSGQKSRIKPKNTISSTSPESSSGSSVVVGILAIVFLLWLVSKLGWYLAPIAAIALYAIIKLGKANK